MVLKWNSAKLHTAKTKVGSLATSRSELTAELTTGFKTTDNNVGRAPCVTQMGVTYTLTSVRTFVFILHVKVTIVIT